MADGSLFQAESDSKRRCCTCKEHKPLSEFNRLASDALGRQPRCRECHRAINDAYNQRPDVKAHRASLRKTKVAEKHAYDVARYQERIKEVSAYNKHRYASQREKIIASVGKWAAENRGRVGVIKKNYRSRRRAQEASGLSTSALSAWLKASEKVCHWCGCDCTKDHHIDHFIPLSKGGRHEIDNLVIACRLCNLRKNARMPDEFMELLCGGFYE